ncbi:hypothetical protein BH10ACI3_BH10ACI3_21870 [soil metagenome]
MSRIFSLFLFLTLSIVFPGIALAQDCTQAALAQKPGVLTASNLSGSTPGVKPSDLLREKAVLMSVHKMVAAAYDPKGVEGNYSFHFRGITGAPSQDKIADTFGYSIYLLKYICDKENSDRSAFRVRTDSPTVLRIDANTVGRLSIYASDISDNTFRGYLLMKNRPKDLGGFYFLGDEVTGDSRKKQKEYTWLITYDNTLPFSYLSQKEYLLLTKARLQKSIVENGNTNGFYDEYVNRVNEYLKKPESELSVPAIIDRASEEKFTGFLLEGSQGSYFAIKHNPAYYRRGLPKSVPQYFTVVFSVWEGDEVPVFVDNMDSIKKAVDFRALRNLLGK